MNTFEFDYANATITEYKDYIDENKGSIKMVEFWDNIPANYIRKYSEYDYKIKQVDRYNYHNRSIK